MKTVTGKNGTNPGNASRENRSNKARLKRLLKAMLASGSAFELCAQGAMTPSYRRVIE